MSYSHTSFSTLKSALAARLGDPEKVFFVDTELGSYLKEALRLWGASALYFRDKGTFNTVSATALYDVGVKLPSQLGRTLTDQNPAADLQYNLLEPSTGNSWTGSDMWTLAEVTAALERRRNQFLVETGQILTFPALGSEIDVPSAPVGVVPLADSIIDVRRAAWLSVEGVYSHLWRTDEFGLNAYLPGWNVNADTPKAYSVILTPNTSLQLAPIPSDAGSLQLITVSTGATLDPATGVLLGVHDDYAQFIKWGALSDLLGKDGQAKDTARSIYCEKRFREGVELAKIAVSIMHAQVNGIPVHLTSLNDFDTHQAGWQNSSGQPSAIAMAGLNVLGLYAVPNDVYSVTCDVVRNAIVPVVDGDYVQVGREYLDTIIDYAQHLALFKCGGAEFEASMQFYENFFRQAANHNSKLKAESHNFDVLATEDSREERQRPRREAA